MRPLLLLLLCLLPLIGAEPAKTDAKAPLVATAEQKAATKAAVEKAWKAMDDARAALRADLDAGITSSKGDTAGTLKAKEFAKAHHEALTAFFSEPENTAPLAIDPRLPYEEQARLKKLNIQLESARSGALNGLPDIFASLGDPNQAQEMGVAYGKEKHLDWLVDLCEGGAKRYANEKPAQKAKAKK